MENTPKPRPAPLPAHAWNAAALNKLKAAALALGGKPEAEPTQEEAGAFADRLPYDFAHIAEATYNPDRKRVEVTLHGGSIRFHVSVVTEAAEKVGTGTARREVA